jgi:osmotically-inducible protein OsmY
LTHGNIASELQKRFMNSRYPALRSITCEQVNGRVVLRGQVSSYHEKQLAQELIRDIAGSLVIANFIDVAVP